MLKSFLKSVVPFVKGGINYSSCGFSTSCFTAEVEEFEYKAETQRLLEIVTHSLYQKKEIFIRELISNASDALERRRQYEFVKPHEEKGKVEFVEDNSPYGIAINLDKDVGTFEICDTGIGMTRSELEQTLGTICYSGSQEFQNRLDSSGREEDVNSLIGQFGVGFYSVFMVSNEVEVISRSRLDDEGEGWKWSTSAGSPTFTIEPYKVDDYGTRISLSLKKDHIIYSEENIVEEIVKTYSHFVGYPILLNDSELEALDALWTRPKDQISDEEHTEFFKYLSRNPFEKDPFLKIVFQTDIPLQIQSIFYIPQSNEEDMLTQLLLQQHQQETGEDLRASGVQLYSNKILVSSQPGDILPKWLRFVKGVVDSADFPINVSRETFQDSSMLISRIRGIITKKIISELKKVMKDDPAGYSLFYKEYEKFLKEGATSDYPNMEKISDLLLFDSYKKSEKISFQQYVENMNEGQAEIYYLVGTNRENAVSSPYFDIFKEKGIEVLLAYEPVVDDFLFEHLGEYSGFPIIRIDRAMIGGSGKKKSSKTDNEEIFRLCNWMEEKFPMTVSSVETTDKLASSSPAIVLNPQSQTERFAKAMQNNGTFPPLEPQKIAINPENKLIQKLGSVISSSTEDVIAYEVLEQILDNCLVYANLLEDPKIMVTRMNKLLEIMMLDYEIEED